MLHFWVCYHGLQGMPSWTSRYAIMDFKTCHHGLQDMPSWTSRYAIMDFKVCHHGLQGMPSRTSRYAIMDMRRVSFRVAFARRESFNNYSPWDCSFEAFYFMRTSFFRASLVSCCMFLNFSGKPCIMLYVPKFLLTT